MKPIKNVFSKYIDQAAFPFGRVGTGPRPTDDLTPVTRDALFNWQVRGQDFQRLDAHSLLQAKICETKYYANDVFKTCHSIGIINPVTGHPDTTKIDKSMVHKIAIISVPKQKELVHMLFFWEEECIRWRLLEQEERELMGRLEGEEGKGTGRTGLEEALKVVRAKKRVVPSLRDESGRVREAEEERLPGYEESG